MSLNRNKAASLKPVTHVVPVVVILIAGFMILAGRVFIDLARDRMTYKSEKYASYITAWSERILSELKIYKETLDAEGSFSEHTFDMLGVSYGSHDEYPFGVYWGDEYGNFYDASGWDPGPEYVPSSRNWFIEGRDHNEFAFGEPYIDVRTGRPCVSATVKTDRDGVQSVLAADIYFDYAEELIDKISAQEIEKAFFISNKNKMIIACSDSEYTGQILGDISDSEFYGSISKLVESGSTGIVRVKGKKTYYVNIYRIPGVEWCFVTSMRESAMLEELRHVNVYIFLIGAAGCVLLVILTHRASTEISRADKEAKTDQLTRLPNRDGFLAAVRYAVKNDPDRGVMLMLDIDNFKMVNDEMGHAEGDEFLKAFAQLLSDFFNRSGDIAARLGGDEFAVFCGKRSGSSDISAMLNIFLKKFHERFDEKYFAQNVSVSIGASFAKDCGGNPEKLYSSSDKALYMAKNSGKNRYVISDET